MPVNSSAVLLSTIQSELLPKYEASLWNDYLVVATTRLGLNLRDAHKTLPDLEHYLAVKDAVVAGMYDTDAKRTLSEVAEQDIVTGCMNYTGALTVDGYGPHRVTFKRFYGEESIAPGLQIDHICDNRACQNPIHMVTTTQSLNTRRAKLQDICQRGHLASEHADHTGRCTACKAEKTAERRELIKAGLWVSTRGRRTETRCANGHNWTPESTYIRPDLSKECKVCREEYRTRSESKGQFALAS